VGGDDDNDGATIDDEGASAALQQRSDVPPPPPPPLSSPPAKASKVAAKYIVLLVVLVSLALGALLYQGSRDQQSASPNPLADCPTRSATSVGLSGLQSSDEVASTGHCVELEWMQAKVISDSWLGQGGELDVNISYFNNDSNVPQGVSESDWTLQKAGGNGTTPDYQGGVFNGSGNVDTGASATGRLVWSNVDPGTYYLIWQPDASSNDRGVWVVELNG
jgi:hypothetical protein